jgi:alkaline phosphatase
LRLPGLAVLAAAVSVGCAAHRPPAAPAAAARARNVILFLADAGGLATLHGASVQATGSARGLFLHTLPHVAVSETSTASDWVTDSAAGMTAIVTGRKTHDGVLSQSDAAVRRKTDGAPLKTILEYAEERGLSTGVVTNSSVLSATPAACYAHVNDRGKEAEIFAQLLKPRFGDGVDVVIGDGLSDVNEAAAASGRVAREALGQAGLLLYDTLEAVPASARRAAVLFDADFDLDAATQRAIDVLSRNPKGFFLMVEGNVHVEELLRGLNRTVELDRAMRRAAERLGEDTLILFTADHSYDFRVHAGRKGDPLVPAGTAPEFGDDVESLRLENIRREDDHTGEDVLVAARGPGASRVRGFLSNTDLFHVMFAAFGWEDASAR